ncbi:hypothetical protein SAPIO_CDS3120 [Scedosporium apiospermum]|uniref:mRNA splicing factor RNA helicase n=1 Tax=Pseudallescheria apiosperma TaxID=563466 RepID=A0A084GA30_PSEDA|nr:uncharacterized protein SAPIO_CDS3120 [Scedosporium apiospermum]KEZ44192.1 hypothetical protein SAPIO_CDS3120 [Scedosporium apiospermum]
MEPTPTAINDTTSNDTPVVFRAKRKKATIRNRPDDIPSAADTPSPSVIEGTPAIASRIGEEEDDGPSVAEVLRQRRKQQRLGGIGFGPEKPLSDLGDEEVQEQAVVRAEGALDADAILGGIPKRFAVQTGLVGELVNKHMMEYVESKLTSRHATLTGTLPPQQQPQQQGVLSTGADASTTPTGGFDAQKRTIHGKLMEVDLGEEVRNQNVALTEKAKRKLEGRPFDGEEQEGGGSPRKTRLGRDGQPIRGRNRRNSDDIKRDQLVEQILHENRLDVYHVPEEQTVEDADHEYEGSADDRIAEEFKREFLDAVAQRRQRRRAARAARPTDKKPNPDVLRGPKLGGSRNVRSAVRDILLQQEKDKAKAGRR